MILHVLIVARVIRESTETLLTVEIVLRTFLMLDIVVVDTIRFSHELELTLRTVVRLQWDRFGHFDKIGPADECLVVIDATFEAM